MLQKCRLCFRDKVLIKSHIVPEGFYESLYDEKRRVFLHLNLETLLLQCRKGRENISFVRNVIVT